jgi:hypothetical protein
MEEIKLLLASLKSFTTFENPPLPYNPLQEACSSFQVAACDSKKLFRKLPVIMKIILKADYDMYAGENRTMTSNENVRTSKLCSKYL